MGRDPENNGNDSHHNNIHNLDPNRGKIVLFSVESRRNLTRNIIGPAIKTTLTARATCGSHIAKGKINRRQSYIPHQLLSFNAAQFTEGTLAPPGAGIPEPN